MNLFCRLGTQWRVGMTGATGLDYAVLFRLMDEDGIVGDERRVIFADVQALEVEALQVMKGDG